MNKIKGKKVKWEDIVREYPDKYAFITDVVEKNGMIDTCTLLQIASFEERSYYFKQFINSDIDFEMERTTFKGPSVGVLNI